MHNLSLPTRLGTFVLTILLSTTMMASADDAEIVTPEIELVAVEFEGTVIEDDLEVYPSVVGPSLEYSPIDETEIVMTDLEINYLTIADDGPMLAPELPMPELLPVLETVEIEQVKRAVVLNSEKDLDPFAVTFVLATGDANLCTNPDQYVGWLCGWQGYPRP